MPRFAAKKQTIKGKGYTVTITDRLPAKVDYLRSRIGPEIEDDIEDFTSEYKDKAPKKTGRLSKGFDGNIEVVENSGEVEVTAENDVPYFGAVEFGTSRTRARPVATQAFEKTKNRINSNLTKVFKEISD